MAADDDLDTTVVRNQPLFDETDDASSAEEPQAPTASDPDGTGFPREAVGAAGVGAAGAAALAYGDSEPVEGRDADREVRDDVLDGGHQDEAVESVTAEGEVRTGHGVEDSDDQAAESIEERKGPRNGPRMPGQENFPGVHVPKSPAGDFVAAQHVLDRLEGRQKTLRLVADAAK